MKIFTHSARAIGAQRATMEFLLINHPLDCPICDQGGECELQDLALGFGRDISRFIERKRVVKDKNIGPLVSTDMTRCIHCTRCVRFGQEIAGIQEMGATGRGEHMGIGTYIEHSVDHELSGNIIDLCPVGALNSKPFRYRGRGWEMTQYPLISPHDGVGTQIFGHVLRGRLMRVVPRAVRGDQRDLDRRPRSLQLRGHLQRRSAARARRCATATAAGARCEWEIALASAAELLRRAGPQLGVLAHPSSTLEELYLVARLAEGLGSANLDHRLRQRDFRDQAADARAPGLGVAIAEIEQLDALLIVGSNLRREVPILAHRVRKAALRGARISFINPARFEYLFPLAQLPWWRAGEQQVAALAAVLRAALGSASAARRGGRAARARKLNSVEIGAEHRAMAESLKSGRDRAIWLGALAMRGSCYAELRALARALAQVTGASLGELAEGGNAAGGLSGGRGAASGHRRARCERRRAQCAADARADAARLSAAEHRALGRCGIARGARDPGGMPRRGGGAPVCERADAARRARLLPAGTFAETSGTYVNLEARWQSHAGAARPLGDCRAGAGRSCACLAISSICHGSSISRRSRCAMSSPPGSKRAGAAAASGTAAGGALARGEAQAEPVLDLPMYQIDAIVRRACALQRTRDGRAALQRYGSGA